MEDDCRIHKIKNKINKNSNYWKTNLRVKSLSNTFIIMLKRLRICKLYEIGECKYKEKCKLLHNDLNFSEDSPKSTEFLSKKRRDMCKNKF
jgi:hypothetical protein